MTKPEPQPAATKRSRPGRKWFWSGFLLVCAGILLLTSKDRLMMSPSGPAVAIVPLYDFYIEEAPRAFSSHKAIGLGSDTGFWGTLLQHLGISIIGGLVAVGLRRVLSKTQEAPPGP